jgi:hypothetical protein
MSTPPWTAPAGAAGVGRRNPHPGAGDLLGDTGLTRDMARAATAAVEGLGGTIERTMQALEPLVRPLMLEAR